MDKKHYQTWQYMKILLFVAFFIYVVSWRCVATLYGTMLCAPKVTALAIWFIASLVMLKISYVKMKKSTDAAEAALFWVINILIASLDLAIFIMVFVLNYI